MFLSCHLFYDDCLGPASCCCLSTLRRICPPLSFSPSFRTKALHVCHTMSAALKLHLQWAPSSGLVSTGRDISVQYNCNPERGGQSMKACIFIVTKTGSLKSTKWILRKFIIRKETLVIQVQDPQQPMALSHRSKSGLGLDSIILVWSTYGLIPQVFNNFRVPPE